MTFFYLIPFRRVPLNPAIANIPLVSPRYVPTYICRTISTGTPVLLPMGSERKIGKLQNWSEQFSQFVTIIFH